MRLERERALDQGGTRRPSGLPQRVSTGEHVRGAGPLCQLLLAPHGQRELREQRLRQHLHPVDAVHPAGGDPPPGARQERQVVAAPPPAPPPEGRQVGGQGERRVPATTGEEQHRGEEESGEGEDTLARDGGEGEAVGEGQRAIAEEDRAVVGGVECAKISVCQCRRHARTFASGDQQTFGQFSIATPVSQAGGCCCILMKFQRT